MKTKLIHITPKAEKIIAYCARVSSPDQDNDKIEGLLKYCINYKHWSIFEMASMCVEIETSRAIAQQILRHRSFHFQEFSQRYAEVMGFETYDARRQDSKNRQNSIDDMNYQDKVWFNDVQREITGKSEYFYRTAIERGIAKEQARFLLPLSTTTKLYMHGTIRDFITYCMVRKDKSTQKEHRDIAINIWKILKKKCPIIATAAENIHESLKNEN